MHLSMTQLSLASAMLVLRTERTQGRVESLVTQPVLPWNWVVVWGLRAVSSIPTVMLWSGMCRRHWHMSVAVLALSGRTKLQLDTCGGAGRVGTRSLFP